MRHTPRKPPKPSKDPIAKRGDVLVHIRTRRLAIVKRVIQDWDKWTYEVGEARYMDDEDKAIDFGDIYIMEDREMQGWKVFDPKDIAEYKK